MNRYIKTVAVVRYERRVDWNSVAQDATQFATNKMHQAGQAIGNAAKFIHDRIFTPACSAANCVKKHSCAIRAAVCVGVACAIATYQGLVG